MSVRQRVVYGPSDPDVFGRYQDRSAYDGDTDCDGCGRHIRQGRSYSEPLPPAAATINSGHKAGDSEPNMIVVCDACNRDAGGFDLCADCYANGGTCNAASTHRLHVFLRALVDKRNQGPYEATEGNGFAQCNLCSKDVVQGAFYSRLRPSFLAMRLAQ